MQCLKDAAFLNCSCDGVELYGFLICSCFCEKSVSQIILENLSMSEWERVGIHVRNLTLWMPLPLPGELLALPGSHQR